MKHETCWLQVLSHLSPKYGGIAASVPRLAKATEAVSSHLCPVVGFCDDSELSQMAHDQRAAAKTFPPDRMRWILDRELRGRLKQTVRNSTGVHIHGLWETHCMISAGLAQECRRPYLISVHGMLERWALRHRRVKKALYAALVEMRRLQRAACLRALSLDEVHDYRRLGLTNPVAVIPNGIDTPPAVPADLFRRLYPELVGKRVVLFLGRLHQKKGLDILLKAFARLRSAGRDLHLVLAGPDSDNMRPGLEAQVDEFRLKGHVTFTDMLTGDMKWSALAAADLFVLPSYSEGFSIAILEALAVGLPVLVTTECHIPEVAERHCGWVVAPEVDKLEAAFNDFLEHSTLDLARMGEHGSDLVNTRFHSSVVGTQVAELYDWLQGGPKPSTVEIV